MSIHDLLTMASCAVICAWVFYLGRLYAENRSKALIERLLAQNTLALGMARCYQRLYTDSVIRGARKSEEPLRRTPLLVMISTAGPRKPLLWEETMTIDPPWKSSLEDLMREIDAHSPKAHIEAVSDGVTEEITRCDYVERCGITGVTVCTDDPCSLVEEWLEVRCEERTDTQCQNDRCHDCALYPAQPTEAPEDLDASGKKHTVKWWVLPLLDAMVAAFWIRALLRWWLLGAHPDDLLTVGSMFLVALQFTFMSAAGFDEGEAPE